MDSPENAAPDALANQQLVALSPADMAPAQQFLADWCVKKIAALEAERTDHETNLELATEHGWKHASVERALTRVGRQIEYYQKIKAAVDAGYVLVPNLPITLFAVRVNRMKQPERTHERTWGNAMAAHPQQLPAGVGRYVDDQVLYRDESFTEKIPDKPDKTIRRYVTDEYDNVEFPMVMAKPAVMAATARAMALKIFDQLGVVQNAAPGRDPIVVGQLLDPRGNRRCVTFFVAWWLDTATL